MKKKTQEEKIFRLEYCERLYAWHWSDINSDEFLPNWLVLGVGTAKELLKFANIMKPVFKKYGRSPIIVSHHWYRYKQVANKA